MKTKTLVAILIAGALCAVGAATARAQDIDSMAPVVVKTVPEAGTKDVAPGEMEIRVTFSKDMMDQSWTWSTVWKDSDATSIGKPHYDTNHRTCILKVKLEPNKTYGYWLNSPNFHGFKDAQGHSAVPYLLVFQTKAQ
jgi:RNA polymerase sigma-70 factor (ECF subfamily)